MFLSTQILNTIQPILKERKHEFFFNIHGSVIRNNILIQKSQQDAHVTEFILPDDSLHVSGIIITHLQEHKTTVITASGNRYTVLLSVAIVEELELNSNRQQYGMYIIHYSIEHIAFPA